jgi:hypothetical protein
MLLHAVSTGKSGVRKRNRLVADYQSRYIVNQENQ